MPQASVSYDPHVFFADFFDGDILKTAAFHLSRRLAEGHICINLDNYNTGLDINRDEAPPEQRTYYTEINGEELKNSPMVCTLPAEEFPDRPFILDGNRLYLQRYWVYETSIINNINRFTEHSKQGFVPAQKSVEAGIDFLRELFHPLEKDHTDRQLLSVITSSLNRFSIITGGPGTGKTYTVTKLLAFLFRLNINETAVMAAPTGKAAARMEDSLQKGLKNINIDADTEKKISSVKAQTIHSLLGYRRDTHRFRHDRDNRLKHSIVIVDEASMIDASLMSKLLEAANDNCRIVLLGDKNQLSSIEAGSIFGDLCRAGSGEIHPETLILPEAADIYRRVTGRTVSRGFKLSGGLHTAVSELTKSRRFSEEKGIGRFSRAVLSAKESVDLDWKDLFDEDEVKVTENEDEAGKLFDKYREYISEDNIDRALELFDSFRILCTNRTGDRGVEEINSKIEKHLGLDRNGSLFYHNRPVMIISNDRQLDLYNGDTGIIRKNSEGRLYFHMRGRDPVPAALLPDCETAFAVTIHKSQGSDYNSVLIYLPQKGSRILSRELLYTAVTRARKKAVIFGSKEIIREAAGRMVKRASGIEDRIKSGAKV